jgi:prophage regulatory protein
MNERDKIFIRPKELAMQLGISLCTLWRYQKQNKLPKAISLGSRMKGWRVETINQWLEEQEKGE